MPTWGNTDSGLSYYTIKGTYAYLGHGYFSSASPGNLLRSINVKARNYSGFGFRLGLYAGDSATDASNSVLVAEGYAGTGNGWISVLFSIEDNVDIPVEKYLWIAVKSEATDGAAGVHYTASAPDFENTAKYIYRSQGDLSSADPWPEIFNLADYDLGTLAFSVYITYDEVSGGPEIISISDDPISPYQQDLIITGTLFGIIQGSGKVYVGNNVTFAQANPVVQSVDSWNDTSIQVDIDATPTPLGQAYLFVEDAGGAVSDAFSVTLEYIFPFNDIDILESFEGVESTWAWENEYLDRVYPAVVYTNSPRYPVALPTTLIDVTTFEAVDTTCIVFHRMFDETELAIQSVGGFDMSYYTSLTIDFHYYMYGPYTGTLFIQLWNGSQWNTEWTLVGSQVDNWVLVQLSFTSIQYSNNDVKIRIVVTPVAPQDGYIAVDNFIVVASAPRAVQSLVEDFETHIILAEDDLASGPYMFFKWFNGVQKSLSLLEDVSGPYVRNILIPFTTVATGLYSVGLKVYGNSSITIRAKKGGSHRDPYTDVTSIRVYVYDLDDGTNYGYETEYDAEITTDFADYVFSLNTYIGKNITVYIRLSCSPDWYLAVNNIQIDGDIEVSYYRHESAGNANVYYTSFSAKDRFDFFKPESRRVEAKTIDQNSWEHFNTNANASLRGPMYAVAGDYWAETVSSGFQETLASINLLFISLLNLSDYKNIKLSLAYQKWVYQGQGGGFRVLAFDGYNLVPIYYDNKKQWNNWIEVDCNLDRISWANASNIPFIIQSLDDGSVETPNLYQAIDNIRFIAEYKKPVILSIADKNNLSNGDLAILTGEDFSDGADAILVLSDAATYGNSTLVTQAVSVWADTQIQFTFDTTGLVETALYLFVVRNYSVYYDRLYSDGFLVYVSNGSFVNGSVLINNAHTLTLLQDRIELGSTQSLILQPEPFKNGSVQIGSPHSLYCRGGVYPICSSEVILAETSLATQSSLCYSVINAYRTEYTESPVFFGEFYYTPSYALSYRSVETESVYELLVIVLEKLYVNQRYQLDALVALYLNSLYVLDAAKYIEKFINSIYVLNVVKYVEKFVNNISVLAGKDWLDSFLQILNEARVGLGLQPVARYHGPGEDIATIHSRNMLAADIYNVRGFLPHDDVLYPVGYQTFAERFNEVVDTPDPTMGLENLFSRWISGQPAYEADLPSPQDMFDAWWASPVHKANLLHVYNSDDNPTTVLGFAKEIIDDATVFWYITSVFFGYGIPEGSAFMDIYYDQQYAFEGGNVLLVGAEQALSAYTHVEGQHEIKYSLLVEAQHEISYTGVVASQHETPIYYTLTIQHIVPYTSMLGVVGDHIIFYDLKDKYPVVRQYELAYSMLVASQHKIPFAQAPTVLAQHAVIYEQLQLVAQQHEVVYVDMLPIFGDHSLVYSLNLDVRQQHYIKYGDLIIVASQHEMNYDLLSFEPVLAQHTIFYSLLPGSSVVDIVGIVVTVGDVLVTPSEVSINSPEGSALWQCKMVLSLAEEYALFYEGVQFTIQFGDDTPYLFQYHTKGSSRNGPADFSLIVEGLSPAMTLQSPRVTTKDVSYASPMFFKDIIEDILGQPVTWDILNWSIPAYRVAGTGIVPLDFAKDLVARVGAVLESNPDGSLLVRAKYAVNLPDYPSVIEDHVFSDLEDNLSAQDTFELTEGYNKFRVSEASSAFSDRIEFILNDDSETQGVLRVYPSPWRNGLKVRTTDDSGMVFINNEGWQERSETQTVQIIQGSGSLSFPAKSIEAVTWHSQSLGAIIQEPYTSTVSTSTEVNDGYGLVDITYTVRFLEYQTSGPAGAQTQYVVEDI